MTGNWKQWEGQVVNGKFLLRQYLGGSDQSAVFLTEFGEEGGRKAAIKLIPADPASAEFYLSRLRRSAKLSHPHVMKLYEVGRCQVAQSERLYIVMEYADEDLSQILPERPLTPLEAREMLEPVLRALEYLHHEGFVHGHIKPSNILAVNDQIRISSDRLYSLNEQGGTLGKPGAYDPPEAASGTISPAADVWALGITLAETLTQHLPVREKTGQMEMVVPETLPSPFLDIVRHCLRLDPQRRSTLADIALRLRPPSPLPPIQSHASAGSSGVVAKHRSNFLWVAVVILGLAAILAISILLHRRPSSQPVRSSTAESQVIQPNPEMNNGIPEAGQPTKNPTHETESSGGLASPSGAPQTELATDKTLGSLNRGEVLHQVLPNVSQTARDTIRGKIRVSVKVAVDPSGNVVEATVDPQVRSRYFANLALEAARSWKFRPAKVESRDVSREWQLQFEFERTGTKVIPMKTAPLQAHE